MFSMLGLILDRKNRNTESVGWTISGANRE